MSVFQEQQQQFTFPDSWHVVQYDGSVHATQTMQKWRFGIRTQRNPDHWTDPIVQIPVDFVAWNAAKGQLIFIEVKDYRITSNLTDPVPAHLADWVAWKVRDSLSGLSVAAVLPSSDLHDFAKKVLSDLREIHVFVDVKWPTFGDPPSIRRKQHQTSIEAKLRPFVDRVTVVDPAVPVPWTTADLP
jgi:hypothetical protein